MALKDGSGRITIDEQAAQQDVVKIWQAKERLDESLAAITRIINQASTERGQTTQAIIEKATELRKQIVAMTQRLDDTSDFIRRTIAHYQEVDRQLKEAIQSSAGIVTGAINAVSAAQPSADPPLQRPPMPSAQAVVEAAKPQKDDGILDDVVDAISDTFAKWFMK